VRLVKATVEKASCTDAAQRVMAEEGVVWNDV
jgi:hypothetical protein